MGLDLSCITENMKYIGVAVSLATVAVGYALYATFRTGQLANAAANSLGRYMVDGGMGKEGLVKAADSEE